MKLTGNIRGFFKTTAIYGVIGGARSLIEFFLLPLYSRYLSPGEFGIFDILMLFIMIGGVAAMLEIGNAVFRFYFDDPSRLFRRSVVSTSLLFMALNGAVIFGLFVLLAGNFSAASFDSFSKGHLFVLAGAYIFFNSLVTIPVNLLRIKDEPGKFTLISLFQIALSVIGICFFVMILKWGVAGILLAKIISMIPTFIICLYLAGDLIGFSFDMGLLKKMLKYSLPLIPASVAIWGINGINRLFMLHYLDLEQIGLYSVGTKFIVVVTLSVIAFQLAWPQFSLANMNSHGAEKTFAGIFNIIAAVGVWMVLGVTLFADTLIRFGMTPEYYSASRAVLPLALGMFMYGIFYFFSTGAIISKSTGKVIPPIIVAVAADIVLNLYLTPRFGFVGTSWATAVSYFVMMLTMMLSTRKYDYVAYEWPRLIRFITVAVPFAIMSGWLAEMNNILIFLIKGLIFFAFPVVLFLTGFVNWPIEKSSFTDTLFENAENGAESKRCVESLVE